MARHAKQASNEPPMKPDVDIIPGVGILGVFGHLNYKPWFALAEYVDNAIQSAQDNLQELSGESDKHHLRVDIRYEEADGGCISIFDNAGGIKRHDFGRAFKAAETPPNTSGLSEFGMGMKSASIWFARKWKVITTSIDDENEYTVTFDMNEVLEKQLTHLDVTSRPVGESLHYTRIELRELNQPLRGKTQSKVRDHLKEIYRSYIRDEFLLLTFQGQSLVYQDPAILDAPYFRDIENNVDSPPTHYWKKSIDFSLEDGSSITGWMALRAEGKTNGNGITLFRRGRVIAGTSSDSYTPWRIYGQSNSYASQRLFGELTITGLPVSHTKDGFQWKGQEEYFEEKLRELIDLDPLPLLKQANGYRARKASDLEIRRLRKAADSTAQSAAENLPSTLDAIRHEEEAPELPSAEIETFFDRDFSQDFTFDYNGSEWRVTIEGVSRPDEQSWLFNSHEFDSINSRQVISITINTSHPFVAQYCLGNKDSAEVLFRVATGMTVTEVLMKQGGDGAYAAGFMRRFNTILDSAMSKRPRRNS
ncbi:ATP-binding protein [Corynebacterium variabile]|uniref:ATP-binding protein n=1 Tax=Corynebacterium variabile TaxID=1727 RepID=UPI003FD2D4BE